MCPEKYEKKFEVHGKNVESVTTAHSCSSHIHLLLCFTPYSAEIYDMPGYPVTLCWRPEQ